MSTNPRSFCPPRLHEVTVSSPRCSHNSSSSYGTTLSPLQCGQLIGTSRRLTGMMLLQSRHKHGKAQSSRNVAIPPPITNFCSYPHSHFAITSEPILDPLSKTPLTWTFNLGNNDHDHEMQWKSLSLAKCPSSHFGHFAPSK